MSHPSDNSAPARRSARHGESGSAYLIALMSLVVLTLIGLGLALVTQTEMKIGANEITQQRVLYAADSGISRATGRTISAFDCSPISGADFQMADLDLSALIDLRQEVGVSPMLPVQDVPCPLCMVNNAGGSSQYGAQIYFDIHHAVSATARRYQGSDPDPAAERVVGAFISLQPWPQIPDCYAFANTPAAAAVKM